MTREQVRDFLVFLTRKQLFGADAVANRVQHYCSSPKLGQSSPSEGALMILSSLQIAGMDLKKAEALVSEWLGSVNKTAAQSKGKPPSAPEHTSLMPRQPPLSLPNQPIPPVPTKPSALPSHIGSYRVIKRLGAGAMGEVFECEDESLKRRVAVKRIRPVAVDPEALALFVKEAHSMAKLVHGNVVVIFGAGRDSTGPYIAMQYVRGRNLSELYAQETWGVEQKLRAIHGLASGAGALHSAGIIHRDIKPDNVMVEHGTDRSVLMDLGLALPVNEKEEEGVIAGTPSYMAPEQCSSHAAPVGPYSDVYSIGKTMVKLITGQSIHMSTSPIGVFQLVLAETGVPDMVKTAFNDVIPDDEVRERIVEIAGKCLHADSTQRYPDGNGLAKALEEHFAWLKDRDRRKAELQQRKLEEEQRKRHEQARQLQVEQDRRKAKTRQMYLAVAVGIVALLAAGFFAWGKSAALKAQTEAQARAEAETKAARAAEAARTLEERKSQVARKLVTAQTFMNAADWTRAARELREILSIDEESYAARWLLAEALYNSFDPGYLAEYRWLAERVTDPVEKSRAQFWVVFAGLDRGGLTAEQAQALITQITPGLYRDLAELYFAGHERSRFSGLAHVARQSGNSADAEAHARTSREWNDKAQALIARLDPNHWIVAYVHGFIVQSQDRKLARERLTYAISHNPAFAMAYYWRAAVVQEDVTHPQPISAVHDAERLHVLMPGWPRGELIRAACSVAMAQYWERESRLARDAAERSRLIDESVRWCDAAVTIITAHRTWQGANVYEQYGGGIEGHHAYALYHKARILKDAGRSEASEQARQEAVSAIERLTRCRQRAPLTPEMENMFQQLPPALERLR